AVLGLQACTSSAGQNQLSCHQQGSSTSGSATRKRTQRRTSFTQQQYKELEAMFSQTMFPEKDVQKALATRLNLQEKTVKVWFRNRRFKLKKQQQQEQQSLKQSSQILPPENDKPSSLRVSTKPGHFTSAFLTLNSTLSCEFTSSSDSSEDSDFSVDRPQCPSLPEDSDFAESPTNDFQMEDFQLERLVASVPAVCPPASDITQIIELYSFPDEREVSTCSFSCLNQYLSPVGSRIEGEGDFFCTFCGPAVGPSPGQTFIPSMTSHSSATWSLR
ncbi:PREDICTED: arginine-fifty homeobox, partial [Chinchilla lanigera]|uniref:arginine-fifty homeobox n=1 Tax=Chinchilla lanigera TaxID=34839 RepID=UPI00038EEF2F